MTIPRRSARTPRPATTITRTHPATRSRSPATRGRRPRLASRPGQVSTAAIGRAVSGPAAIARCTAGRRGVSVGVIAALVAVVVLVGAVVLWRFFGDALSDRSDQAAARCVDGELAVAVIADPAIAEEIQTLAGRYNDSAAPVADRCVKIGVKPAESDQVVNGFIGAWPAELGDRPALWIPGSSVSAARLEASSGAQTTIDSRSLVTSPVVLAVRPQLKNALAQQSWSTLPNCRRNPDLVGGAEPSRLGLRAAGATAERRQRCVVSCRGGGRGGFGACRSAGERGHPAR